ncbi:MAG: FAD-dependent oxidoreductase [Spirochaetes bacterium]|nr:FAD-dependent oxidoreductase [Spirochaetota bacterium]
MKNISEDREKSGIFPFNSACDCDKEGIRDGELSKAVFDVVVIGAGIVGSMLLRELSRFECEIAVVEQFPQPGFGVTKSSLSYIHRNHFNPPGTLAAKLCAGARKAFRKLSDELRVDYKETGEFLLALEPSHIPQMMKRKQWGEQNGETGFRIMKGSEVLRREPEVNPAVLSAVYSSGHGMIYPPEWAFALVENACSNGAHAFFGTKVIGIAGNDDGLFTIHTGNGTIRSRFIVNAAGNKAAKIASMTGDDGIELTLSRGTFAIFDKIHSSLVRNILYVGGGDPAVSQVVGPTVSGNLILGLGSFKTPDSTEDTKVTRESLDEIIAMGRDIVPDLPVTDIITFFAGIKSVNNLEEGGDFHIGYSDLSRRVIHLLIGSPGVTASPGIARHVIDLLSDGGLSLVEKKLFDSSREKKEDDWDKGQKWPCGRIVCRCENVTEATIQNAIERGARTIDGVKHLTRAGMGRCQGGFCEGRIIRYLSEALGIEPTEITKKGEGSEQIKGME